MCEYCNAPRDVCITARAHFPNRAVLLVLFRTRPDRPRQFWGWAETLQDPVAHRVGARLVAWVWSLAPAIAADHMKSKSPGTIYI